MVATHVSLFRQRTIHCSIVFFEVIQLLSTTSVSVSKGACVVILVYCTVLIVIPEMTIKYLNYLQYEIM